MIILEFWFGENNGIIKNVTTNGVIKGYNRVGGIVGRLNTCGIIEKCTNNALVTYEENKGYAYYGGIAGCMDGGTISKCINNGEIKGLYGVGGIVPFMQNDAKVELCINKGKITLTGNSNEGTSEAYAGGIADSCGWNSKGTIINCINLADIEVYANVKGASIGGISGLGSKPGSICVMENCYSIANFIKGTNIGGILGVKYSSSGTHTLENNYWIEGRGASYGIGAVNSNTGTTKITEAKLKEISSINLGDAYSKEYSDKNDGYPVLKWQLEE